jgi:endonuclease YncB( thermonuclease family)
LREKLRRTYRLGSRKMNRWLPLSVGFFLILLITLPDLSPAGQSKVLHVYDGDTVRVIEKGREIKVRLVGIDSPETYKGKNKPGQPFSRKSKDYLSKLILGKTVETMSYGTDDYSRMLGVIYLDGISINFEMVRSGLAEVYRAMPPKGFDITAYQAAEKEARKAKRGMWIQGDKYISPRKWRRMHRK